MCIKNECAVSIMELFDVAVHWFIYGEEWEKISPPFLFFFFSMTPHIL